MKSCLSVYNRLGVIITPVISLAGLCICFAALVHDHPFSDGGWRMQRLAPVGLSITAAIGLLMGVLDYFLFGKKVAQTLTAVVGSGLALGFGCLVALMLIRAAG